MTAPRYMYNFSEPVSHIYVEYNRPYFQTASGKIYRDSAELNEEKAMEILKM